MTPRKPHNFSAAALFMRECLRKHRQMGAIAPSSRSLSRMMAKWLPDDPGALIVELGPGSGVVTEALLDRGIPGDRLVAIEYSKSLSGLLRERFPGVHVIEGDAWEMDTLLKNRRLGNEAGAVISSLPLRLFKRERVEALSRIIRSLLRPGGFWVQFTYHIGQKRVHGSHDFHLHATNIVWKNFPPARVNVYRKHN